MKTVYLCSPLKLGDLNRELISRIERLGFKVLCAAIDTPQDMALDDIFHRNVELIKRSDIFVAVLKDYGRDLTAETGMAYAWGKLTVGIDFNACPDDVMMYHAFHKIIEPNQIEPVLSEFLG